MKKFLLTILFLFLSFAKACAYYNDFVPNYTNSINHWGQGAFFAPNMTIIRSAPDKNSKIIQKLYWDSKDNFGTMDKNASRSPRDIFLAFSPKNGIVLLSVLDDNENNNENWYKVCYDQKNGLTGWVSAQETEGAKKGRTGKFYSYSELFFKLGKQNGVHIFRNLGSEFKALYSGPSAEASVVDDFETAKYIVPWLVQGNWMLSKVITYDNKVKTGWLRWRAEDGGLYAFINVQ